MVLEWEGGRTGNEIRGKGVLRPAGSRGMGAETEV